MKKVLMGILSITVLLGVTGCSNALKTSTEKGNGETTAVPGVETVIQKEGTDDSLQKVLDSGTLRAGAEGNWVPFVYNDMNGGDGQLKGYDVEIVEEIARRLGVKVEWNIANKWDGVIAGLQAGRYDLVFCGVTKANLESGADLIGTIPYREDPIVLVVAKNNTEVMGWKDVAGKLSGNALTGDYGAIAKSYGAELTDASLDQSMELLQQGRIDCHINSQIAINTFLKEKPDASIKIVDHYVPEKPEDSYIFGMLTESKTSLRDKIDVVLQEMLDEGYCYNLAVKYFGQDVADNISLYNK